MAAAEWPPLPPVVKLCTPEKQQFPRWRSTATPEGDASSGSLESGSDTAANTEVPSRRRRRTSASAEGGQVPGESSWDTEDVWDSPRLPEEWQPLEYELLEYADKLPPGFADRVGSELDAQTRTLSELRARTQQLIQKEVAAGMTKEDVTAGMTKEDKEEQHSSARRAQLAENARQLEGKARQVRRVAEKELTDLTSRIRTAEEQQRQLSKEAAEDAAERKRLWESEAELLRLRCRLQQLDAARRHTERRAAQREDEERQLEADLAYLKLEVQTFRARTQESEVLEQREEELRRRLRAAKLLLRTQQRASGAPLVPSMARSMGMAESTASLAGVVNAEVLPPHQLRKGSLLVRHPSLKSPDALGSSGRFPPFYTLSPKSPDSLSLSAKRRSHTAAHGGA